MFRLTAAICSLFFLPAILFSQTPYNGIESGMNNIYRLSDAKTRSISPENFTGEKGKGGMATTELAHVPHGNLARDGR